MKRLLSYCRQSPRVLGLVFGCAFLVLLTGCGMKTELKVNSRSDAEFAGERVIVCDEITNTSLMFSSAKVTDITDCLKKNCPPQMEFSCAYSDSKQTKAVYTFKVKFTGMDDYKTKIAALLGRTPSVEYAYKSPDEALFKSGFSLTEDFESKDLLAWVKPALKKDLNISRDISSLTDSVTVTMNGTSFDNENLLSARVKINTIAQYRLSSLDISTIRYGDDEYTREVTLNIPQDTVKALGKDNIQQFLEAGTAENAGGKWLSEKDGNIPYLVSFSGTADTVNACTRQLFGDGCSFAYTKDETLYTPFSETGVLAETLAFDKFPCESDGSSNVTLTYKNMDASEFDRAKSTLFLGDKPKSGEGLSEDAKTMTLVCKKNGRADVKLYSSTIYKLSEVDVTTEIGMDDKVCQCILLVFPIDTKDYGAQFAANYFNQRCKDSGITVTVGEFRHSDNQFAVTIATPKDTAENVSALLTKYIGAGNQIQVEGQDKFSFYNKRTVSVSVDLAEMLQSSQYTGEIMYSFKGSGQAYDVDWTSSSGGKSDILMGAFRSEFEHPISSGTFSITYHLRRINLMFVLLIAALAVTVIGAFVMGIGWMALRKRRKSEETRLAAVKTMALVKLPDGTETMMEVTPEEAANTVVIAPKHDDGLDEDDDEPENVWLFATALKLFSIMACVLFFLGFATIEWTEYYLPKSSSVSGLKLVIGHNLLDHTLEGGYLNAILVVIPVIILLLLSFRRPLPTILSDMVIIGLSALQIWYLLGIPTELEEHVDAFAAEVSRRMTMQMDWPYNYSIVIYVLLALGGLILLLIDSGLSLHRNAVRKNADSRLQDQ